MVIPAGTRLTNSLQDTSEGKCYTSEYGIVGPSVKYSDKIETIVSEGINQNGLYVGGFYFSGFASYSPPDTVNVSRNLAPEDYMTWLLATCSTVEEVRDSFDQVVLVEHPRAVIDSTSLPIHFVVHDTTGACVVIEPVNKSLKIHDNPLGVITNSPPFDWHINNLTNYLNLTATNAPPCTLGTLVLSPTGMGSGMLGLPGDFTPPSRFVRAVAYSQSAIKCTTAEETVLQAFHIMNTFDIPKGAARKRHNEKFRENDCGLEYTQWTSVSDLKNKVWAFRTYDDPTIRSVDVQKALKKAKRSIMFMWMDVSPYKIEDVTDKFTPLPKKKQ